MYGKYGFLKDIEIIQGLSGEVLGVQRGIRNSKSNAHIKFIF